MLSFFPLYYCCQCSKYSLVNSSIASGMCLNTSLERSSLKVWIGFSLHEVICPLSFVLRMPQGTSRCQLSCGSFKILSCYTVYMHCPNMAHRPGLWLLKILELLVELFLPVFGDFFFVIAVLTDTFRNRCITLQFLPVHFSHDLFNLLPNPTLNVIQIPLYYLGVFSHQHIQIFSVFCFTDSNCVNVCVFLDSKKSYKENQWWHLCLLSYKNISLNMLYVFVNPQSQKKTPLLLLKEYQTNQDKVRCQEMVKCK